MTRLITRVKQSLVGLLLLACLPVGALAAIDTYEFKDETSRVRFQKLNEELRCPKCQNQNLADSNSPIAADLRREVYRMVEDGQSDSQIVDFMVARYGEFVLYKPRVASVTYVLWYGPVALLVIGGVVVVLVARRRRSKAEKSASVEGEKKQRRLHELLDDDST